jgi:hypothetical protein
VPLLLEQTPTHSSSIIVMADDGLTTNILIYNLDDLRFPAHTLLVGSSPAFDSMINHVVVDGILYAISANGQVVRWELVWRDDKPTSYIYGDIRRNRISDYEPNQEEPTYSSLLVGSETYNWPNPASDHTHIRFLTSESADITFSIISYSGKLIYEADTSSGGGLSNEYRIDTSNWSNGVYFCRVTAKSGGKTEHKVITVVVTR